MIGLFLVSLFGCNKNKLKKIRSEHDKSYVTMIMLTNHTPFSDVDKYDERNWGGNAYEYALTLCFDAIVKM